MDWLAPLYPQVYQVFEESVPTFWPDLRNLVVKILDAPFRSSALLPLASCRTVDGDPHMAIHVAAAVVATEACLRIFDDLQDQDRPHQLWEQVGPARAWNFASALHVLAFNILRRAPYSPAVFFKINQLFIDSYMCIKLGQERALTWKTITVESYWSIMELKTAIAYSAACGGGAIAGTTNPMWIEACGLFGHHIGLGIQVFNDYESLWEPEGLTDLEQGKITLPLTYALNLDHVYRPELESLVTSPETIRNNASRIQAILEKVDTKTFMVWAALKERKQALDALAICPNEEGKAALTAFVTGMFGDIDEIVA